MDLTELIRTRSSASSRRVATRPVLAAESSSSRGIMVQPWASSSPREVTEDSLDRGPISRSLGLSGGRNHRFADASRAIPVRPNPLPLLCLRRFTRPP